ncbi:RluA family pseudouridine synthase [Marinicrinis lubricantis]|uniref:Pseudouridine synthase n=1 Tax=Marinicrinis lubricantis TaxID=2086470 RepID=A0ABW1IM63_9BACL
MTMTYYEPLQYTITEAEDGWYLRTVLRSRMNLSRKLVSRLKFTEEGITVNGKRAFTSMIVHQGDLVEVRMEQESSDDILPQPIPIDIIFEDEHLLIVNKPAGLIVHPTLGHYQNTLANGVVHYWQSKGVKFRFRPIHRLDQETSGVMCIAKNPFVQQRIFEQKDRVLKEYQAIVIGHPDPSEGVIDAPIDRDPENPHYRMVIKEGYPARTHYQVLETYQEASKVRLRLETGRTHQIRVHMTFKGHPLIGDSRYGDEAVNARYPIGRQALHAAKLGFAHPVTGEEMVFEAPFPEDMLILEQELRRTI